MEHLLKKIRLTKYDKTAAGIRVMSRMIILSFCKNFFSERLVNRFAFLKSVCFLTILIKFNKNISVPSAFSAVYEYCKSTL